ncbi:adhesion G protein-coupled receptor E3-like [Engystomops pustulosus]|uniref:adhesion G protein-coupled receptor E3-like n=1 Tax=Engystomops pustulosus TaxID=76066 RepID=UPI003AFA4E29
MDRKFSRHFLLLIFGLTIVTITQQDPPQCLQENKPLTDEKKCPNNWICPSKGDCGKTNLCRCSNGYYKCRKHNVIICKDENECKISKHLCGNSSHCVNTQGGYYCKCDSHHRNGNQTEFCPSVDKEKNKCQEIDECRDNPGICGSNFICHNTNSSYYCACEKGFRNISNTCVDIDECTDIPAICGSHSTCHNTAGSYYCSCDSGFKTKSNTCVDIDECSDFPGICGPNLVCHNTEGSYNCTCKDGLGNIPQSCTQGSSSGKTNTKNEACAVLKLTSNILDSVCQLNYTLTEEEVKQNLEDDIGKLSNILLESSTEPPAKITNSISKLTTTILTNVETFTLKSFIDAPRNQVIKQTELDVTMKVSLNNCSSNSIPFNLNLNDNLMEVPCDVLNQTGDGAILIVYRDLKSIQVIAVDDGKTVNSRLVTGAITRNLTSTGRNVTFQLAHIQELKPSYRPTCNFWDTNKNNWSEEGCTTEYSNSNDTHTTCSCNHLSSFAILMAPSGLKEDHVLDIVSEIGLSLSVFCLLLSLLTFLLCRTMRSAHTSVLTALCSCLLLGQILFLLGVHQTRHKILCAIIAGGLHFLFLAAFCWMSIESILLFMTVRNLRAVNYMTSRRSNFPVMCLLGFGVPAIIVGITAAIEPNGYGTHRYCWLSSRYTIWSFLGPVAVFIITNTILLLFTVVLLRNRLATLNTNVSTLKNSRLLTFKALAQLLILGSTWAIGYFQFGSGSQIISYIFVLCNSLQGVYIFLVHCVFNTQVRQEYRKLFNRSRKGSKQSSNDSTPHNITKSMNLTEMSKPMNDQSDQKVVSWTK